MSLIIFIALRTVVKLKEEKKKHDNECISINEITLK